MLQEELNILSELSQNRKFIDTMICLWTHDLYKRFLNRFSPSNIVLVMGTDAQWPTKCNKTENKISLEKEQKGRSVFFFFTDNFISLLSRTGFIALTCLIRIFYFPTNCCYDNYDKYIHLYLVKRSCLCLRVIYRIIIWYINDVRAQYTFKVS